MKRSHWSSKVLFILTALTITLSLLENILHVHATPPSRTKLFVLIQGVNTDLQNNIPPIYSFGAENGIAPYLSRTYPGSQFLMYSYNGDNGNGYPIAYQCQDTFTTDAKADALKLAKQLQDYLQKKPAMDVYLIAHSYGGLVAYGYLSYLLIQHIVNGSIPGTMGDRIAGVVTLDTPLGGIPNNLYLAKIFLAYSYINACPKLLGHRIATLDNLFALYKTNSIIPHGGNNSVASTLFNANITNEAIAIAAAQQGIQIATIGNEHDYLFDPAACKMLMGHSIIGTDNYLSTQWLSDRGNSSGIYGRYFIGGEPTCKTLTNLGINHGFVFGNRSVQAALGQFVSNEPLTALPVAIVGL